MVVNYMIIRTGDTAVYLLFAYARLASILRKVSTNYYIHTYIHTNSSMCELQAKDERGIDISAAVSQASSVLNVDHPAGTVNIIIANVEVFN